MAWRERQRGRRGEGEAPPAACQANNGEGDRAGKFQKTLPHDEFGRASDSDNERIYHDRWCVGGVRESRGTKRGVEVLTLENGVSGGLGFNGLPEHPSSVRTMIPTGGYISLTECFRRPG